MHFPSFLMFWGEISLIKKIKNSTSCSENWKLWKISSQSIHPTKETAEGTSCASGKKGSGKKMNIHWNLDLSETHGSSFLVKFSSESLHTTPEWSSTWTDLLPSFWEIRGKNQHGRPWKGESHGEGWTQSYGECQVSSFWYKRLWIVIKIGGFPDTFS